jgi:hypothetical protein
MVNKHITEPLPYRLSRESTGSFNIDSYGYDVAINSQPYFLANNIDRPYRRVTAKYRKDQVDQTTEPGEQTLTGWWLRSQSSFHLGAGIKYYEPSQDDTLRFRFAESKGIDVWTQGEATLLNTTVRALSTSNNPLIIGANDGSADCLVVADGAELKKITMANDTPTATTYSLVAGHATSNVFVSLTTDGSRYFAADNVAIHRGNIGGSTNDDTTYATGTNNVVIRYCKQRLIAGVGPSLYELNPNATPQGNHLTIALPTALYTNRNSSWKWTSISEGPAAFYAAGYAGSQSAIYKIVLDLTTANSLGFADLEVPTVVADFPEGEIVQAFDVYLGIYAVICTNKGTRIGLVTEDGDLSYGPLLFNNDSKAVTFKDRFAYVATEVDGESGLIRIDLSSPIGNTLRFPYAWDLIAAGETVTSTNVASLGSTDRIAFAVNGDGVWIESNLAKVESGYITTGRIRYNTLEPKVYKFLWPRVDLTNGSMSIESIDSTNALALIRISPQGETVAEGAVIAPTESTEFISLKFTFNRNTVDTDLGPLFSGWQLKALPATKRTRLIQFPVFNYDNEQDKQGNKIGYEGRAYEKLLNLERIEELGDTVQVIDYRTGESFTATIEELDFSNTTPPDERFENFGGILLITVRTV